MQRKTLITALMATALALPFAASAGEGHKHDTTSGAKSASNSGANDGGAEAMFAAMDKDGDGLISSQEATGTPHAADFATLDTNADGKLSRDEHYAAKEHVAARTKAGSMGSPAGSMAAPSPTGSTPDAPGSKKTY